MDSEEEAVALLLLLRHRHRCCKRQRTLWMHSITLRLSHGQFYTIMDHLRGDKAKFFNYFRMSPEIFNELLILLGPYIKKANTNMRRNSMCPSACNVAQPQAFECTGPRHSVAPSRGRDQRLLATDACVRGIAFKQWKPMRSHIPATHHHHSVAHVLLALMILIFYYPNGKL